MHFKLAAVFGALVSLASPLMAQDTTLGRIVHRLLRADLVAGGLRDTLTWQAADSGTLAILRQAPILPNHGLQVPPSRSIQCPSSTDSSKGFFQQPVGYTVRARVTTDSLNQPVLEVRVSCTFTYHGKPSPFVEAGKWSLLRQGDGWTLGHQIEHSIT
ncbi:MAG: hypothetical protein ACREOG_16450 [Gemmatimonadaceae bacterium]